MRPTPSSWRLFTNDRAFRNNPLAVHMEHKGWLVLGFEYDTGKLGGDPLYWQQRTIEAYRKAADGGNCIAMMEIGDLYSHGNGVPADNAQAQSWHAKAQSCQSSNLALLQQQAAQYRARAAAARDPMLSAIPIIPKPPAASAGTGSGFSVVTKNVTVELAAIAEVIVALDALVPSTPSSGNANIGSVGNSNLPGQEFPDKPNQ